MPYCAKCGSPVTDGTSFCSRCGAPVGAAVGRPDAPVPPVPQTPPPTPAGSGMSSNVAGMLSYVLGFITGIIFLVLEPYRTDRFVRFHAFQSIFFSVAMMVFWIVWSQLFWLVSFGFFWTILSLIGTLVWLAAFLFWLFLLYKAYNGERFMIPVIGDLAARQAG